MPSLGELQDPGIEPVSLASSALAGRFFTTNTIWEAQFNTKHCKNNFLGYITGRLFSILNI